MESGAQLAPPAFARMAADPLRWRLLRELARSDRQVRELVALAGHPQNLVSYHLGQLRASGLVGTRRSSFDGRHTYYHLDLARCAQELAAVGASLHPDWGSNPPIPAFGGRGPDRRTVLFCARATAPGRRPLRHLPEPAPAAGFWRSAPAITPSRCTRTRCV